MTYVVIYDLHNSVDEPDEQYYGFFATPTEARRMFSDMIAGNEQLYSNVWLCKVETILDIDALRVERVLRNTTNVDDVSTLLEDWR